MSMRLIKIIYSIVTVCFISQACCNSYKYLPECNCELDVDTTNYLSSEIFSDSENFKREFLKEEIKNEELSEWLKNRFNTSNIESILGSNWERVRSQLKNKDRIFYYSTVDDLAGFTGLVIIRDCKIIFKTIISFIQY